ncbi:MAG TPA: trypsin-like peptidase domain-containing protein [Patescibacteria group bacterium]|nr:trypsin-like peptidase domain-containing protein [Patescibacteria group bacterium]
MRKLDLRKVLIIGALIIVVLVAIGGGAVADRVFGFKPLDSLFPSSIGNGSTVGPTVVTSEEQDVENVVAKSSPSVVTVSGTATSQPSIQFDPFGGGFSQTPGGSQSQDIGSGFIVSANGLIVTNKHVVSDTTMTYKVITEDNKEYPVQTISRDPNNDIAVLKINANGLTPITLGDSTNLKVGQSVIAIGTALGQFRHSVTTGVVSGLGRGIQAGDPYQGYVEELDNIIQTDAAINPGNSGGPLINSSNQVIGINVAVAQGAQNIGFAIPINVVKDALNTFTKNGGFPGKAFLGVQYQMISQQAAILNDVPQGAYVTDVVTGSAADKAGVQTGDIITKADGQTLNDNSSSNSSSDSTQTSKLAQIINGKKVGDSLSMEVWRNGQTLNLTATLAADTSNQ